MCVFVCFFDVCEVVWCLSCVGEVWLVGLCFFVCWDFVFVVSRCVLFVVQFVGCVCV